MTNEPHETWIRMETFRDPINPWPIAVVGYLLIMGIAALLLLLP